MQRKATCEVSKATWHHQRSGRDGRWKSNKNNGKDFHHLGASPPLRPGCVVYRISARQNRQPRTLTRHLNRRKENGKKKTDWERESKGRPAANTVSKRAHRRGKIAWQLLEGTWSTKGGNRELPERPETITNKTHYPAGWMNSGPQTSGGTRPHQKKKQGKGTP